MNFSKIPDEDELVARLKQKNVQAFNDVYNKYGAPIFTVVLQILRDEGIAINITKEVFLKIIDNIGNYNSARERLFIWMFKIARNIAIDAIKKNDKHTLIKPAVTEKISERATNLEMDNYGLKKIIMKLEEDQKILVDLCYFKGCTYDEVAEKLNIPAGTVKEKLNTAMLKLKTLLI